MNRLTLTNSSRVFALLALGSTALGVHPAFASDADTVARGKYIVTVSGCNDCHTPWKDGPAGPEPDMTRMLSGHPESFVITAPAALPPGPWLGATAATNTAFTGPWGVSFTANLTPDKETGLGKWDLKTFTQTIRTGRHMGRGRKILPPMPIPMYKNFNDEDLAAIFAYLQSIPAIKNQVPDPLPPAAPAPQGGG
jgi:mono/diheme cytochrome c family protein